MAKPRKVRASARALEKQRAKKLKPLYGIRHKPYRIWAVPSSHPHESLARFIEQGDLAKDYEVCVQAWWVTPTTPWSEEFALKLAVNDRVRCAGPYCLIHYPLEV